MSVEVVHIEANEVVGVCRPVVIRLVDGGTTEIAHIDRLTRLLREQLERSPSAGLWVILHHGTPPPSFGVARHGKHEVDKIAGRVGVVYSMLGIGFWAAATRKAATVFNAVLGTPSPIETTVEAGAQRMALELVGVDPGELLQAHAALAERLAAHQGMLNSSAC